MNEREVEAIVRVIAREKKPWDEKLKEIHKAIEKAKKQKQKLNFQKFYGNERKYSLHTSNPRYEREYKKIEKINKVLSHFSYEEWERIVKEVGIKFSK